MRHAPHRVATRHPGHPRTMMLRALTAALAVALLTASAATAQQTSSAVSDAANALRTTPVYVDPGARHVLPPDQQRRVEQAIARRDAGPLYIAVFPEQVARTAGGSPDGVGQELMTTLRRPGVYAVAVGHRLLAGQTSGQLDSGEPARLVREAIDAHRGEGLGAILADFATRVGEARANGGSASSGGGGGGGALLAVVAVVAVLGGGLLLLSRGRRRREQAAEVADLREAARDDLVALGDDVRELDIPIEQRDADPRARQALDVALQRYEEADRALGRARRPEDFAPITEALEEGRYEMEVARAHLEGRPPPERRPPCFFDPRHGPSTREVPWAPPGGESRPVPVCEADARRIEQGFEPQPREVLVGGERMPYYQAPAYFGPWAGGFFGGGLLPGMLLGTMLGGSLFGPAVAYGDWDGNGGDGGDGGDWGGGDWGGGDFGGGDFGGGDF